MAESAVQGYDIIGDVHGCADKLEALLTKLGYQINGGAGEYRHPKRQAVFVGDLIDRGPDQLRVLEVVKDMVDAGSAKIVMGNHEFNALGYHCEHPDGSGEHLRTHSAKHIEQHEAFLKQVTGKDRERYLAWFATMPLWLDLDGLRVVHACWDKESMATVEKHCESSAPFADVGHLAAAHDKTHELYDAIENLLKGPEISLVEHGEPPYRDVGGHLRKHARIRWWDSGAVTLRDIAVMSSSFTTEDGEPYPPLPELPLLAETGEFVYTGKVPVFYGHYWRQGSPQVGEDFTDRTACVDFSAGKGGPLMAYQWSRGETTIRPDNYVQLD
ncbi:metallophosphoesterase [Mycolicibacter senuensis]|uniref:Metallophosphatase n=1 Tax=Mycolicibacter senuensis TaxID=386913 RepID=A0A7I9XQE0_9MYCO|nr:metallophosphoesterase [Mycolicibacter senuensis]ORW66815.1 metallophosphatase [Mycolicibacter senuensis]GFG72203.1 metallophosphatase [Mycolicibacter senuensis]